MADGDEQEVRPGWLAPRAPSAPSAPLPPSSAPRPAPAAPRRALAPTFATRAEPGAGGRVDPLATAALVAGLLGLILLTISLGLLFLVALPCSALAWLLGSRAKGRIASEPERSGSGIAHAGAVLGLIGLGIGTLAMIVWTVLILSGFTVGDLQRELEERRDRPDAPAQRASR